MTEHPPRETIGALRTPDGQTAVLARSLTRLVWLLVAASLGVLGLTLRGGGPWSVAGVVTIDGLTAVMWVAVTGLSGVVHSYARRYMAGSDRIDAFFLRTFAFTVVVLVLVAAEHLALFWLSWLLMGLLMAALIGHVDGWPAARAAARLARRYFLASTAALGVGLLVLSWYTGRATVAASLSALELVPQPTLLAVAGTLLLAAMIQSALLPFHAWLLSSMTAPTPASALMHAGFVNAGGILLVRFGPVVAAEPWVMLLIVVAGAASAIAGKFLKTVQPDVKAALGCSTVAQMGFMIMQAGLGLFAAAITHLVLHGCYKAYSFLSAGGRVAHEAPPDGTTQPTAGPTDLLAVVLTAGLGGVMFVALTGKATTGGTGLVLVALVVLTVLHATRELVAGAALPAPVRYGAVPAVAIPAVAIYALLYRAVRTTMADLPGVGQPQELGVVHGLVLLAFVVAYVAMERGLYRHSTRLYVALVNAARPRAATSLTAPEGRQ